MASSPIHLVVMGVSGCGKSSVGAALSSRLAIPYADGDDLHPAENVDRMRQGKPLTDQDRWPWLDHCGRALADAQDGLILGCSALRRVYRDRLRSASGMPDLFFIHLTGSHALLHKRMSARQGHYMPASLLQSQLDTLEPPGPDENAVAIDIDQSIQTIIRQSIIRMTR